MSIICKVFGHKKDNDCPSEVVNQDWDEEDGVVVLSLLVYMRIFCLRCGTILFKPDVPDVMEV